MSSRQEDILGKFFVAQQIAGALSEEADFATYLCRAFVYIPGILDAQLVIADNKYVSPVRLQAVPQTPRLISFDSVAKSRRVSTPMSFALATQSRNYGTLELTVSDPNEIEQYIDFIKNSANTIATTLENRNQANELKCQNEELTALKEQLEVNLKHSETSFNSVATSIAEGVIFLDHQGNITIANAAAEDILQRSAPELIGQLFTDVFQYAIDEDGNLLEKQHFPPILTLHTGAAQINQVLGLLNHQEDVKWISMNSQVLNPIADSPSQCVVITFQDITARKRSEERIHRLTHLYKALTELNQAIVRMQDETELLPLVCRCAVEFGGLQMAWVGQIIESEKKIEPVASYGNHLDYLDGLFISTDADSPYGQGPAGKAVRNNRAVIFNDVEIEPEFDLWREKIAKHNWQSIAAFPINRSDKTFALLFVYHTKRNAFDEETITLLSEMALDITFALNNFDREAQRKAAEESKRLAALVYEASSEAMVVSDGDNKVIALNSAFTEITGFSSEDILERTNENNEAGTSVEDFFSDIWQQIDETGKWQGEVCTERKNGIVFPVRLMVNTIFNDDDSVKYRVSLFTDISEQKQSQEMIWRQSNIDPLTDLPNRRMFHDRLEQEIKKSDRSGLPLVLLFLDLDNFKEINDSFGHAIGDLLLKQAAERLTRCVRLPDTIARLGGDEFTIILSEFDSMQSVDRVIYEILHAVSQPFQLMEKQAYISVSIGVTIYPTDANDADTLLKNADQAMYAAKNAGRNQFSYFTVTMQDAAQKRMLLAAELRRALYQNQVWVAYQPIVDLKTGLITKAEALARWTHPELGVISPVEFIPIAEHTGQILELGQWIFQHAIQQVKQWQSCYFSEFQISVNTSPVQIQSRTSRIEPWGVQLENAGLSGKSIVAEITEGLILDPNTFINTRLLEFRDAGIEIALDDFGTGYSSLSYLKKFDIDYLKIDKSFVSHLAPKSDDLALCEAMILMAHKLGMKVIAEGIETEQSRRLLTEAGCDFGQGFLFSQPVSVEDFEKLLKTQ